MDFQELTWLKFVKKQQSLQLEMPLKPKPEWKLLLKKEERLKISTLYLRLQENILNKL